VELSKSWGEESVDMEVGGGGFVVKGAEDLLIQEAIETLVSGNAEGALEIVEPQLGCGDYNAEMVAASALLALGRELEAEKCLRQMEMIVNRLFAAKQTAEPGFNPGSLLQMLGNLGKEKRVLPGIIITGRRKSESRRMICFSWEAIFWLAGNSELMLISGNRAKKSAIFTILRMNGYIR
jgi:hypothetical protein